MYISVRLFCFRFALSNVYYGLFCYRFALSNVYYGLTIAAGEMGSSRYISLILSSLTDIPCYIIALYTVEHKR